MWTATILCLKSSPVAREASGDFHNKNLTNQNMNTRTLRGDHFGWFAEKRTIRNADGSVTFHDDPRYKLATNYTLLDWMEDGSDAVVNAAIMELDDRDLGKWASRY